MQNWWMTLIVPISWESTQEAIALLNQSIRYDSMRMAPWVTLGVIYFNQKMYQECIDAESRALALNPEDGKGYYNRALAYHAMAKYDSAAK
jgi:tetratricopeptide (TPR) repeat protein